MGQQIAGFLDGGMPTRPELAELMQRAPPLDPGAVAVLVANADLLKSDYALAGLEILGATAEGKRAKMLHYGVGALCGLVAGIVVCKVL